VQGLTGTTFQSINQWRLGGFANPVPEPTTMLLFGMELAGIAAKVRKRRKTV
jgi:hypothetical protein